MRSKWCAGAGCRQSQIDSTRDDSGAGGRMDLNSMAAPAVASARTAWLRRRGALQDRFAQQQLPRETHRRRALGEDAVVVGLHVERRAGLRLGRLARVEVLLRADEVGGQLGGRELGADPLALGLALLL